MARSYTYVVARIRALEARMLHPVHVSRMVEAPDLERAFFILSETAYADHISGAIHPFDFMEIIDAEVERAHRFLKTYAGDDCVLMALWRKYDYANAKALLRSAVHGRENLSLSSFGVVDVEDISHHVLDGAGAVPVWLEDALSAAAAGFEEERRPERIDEVLDKAYIDDLYRSGNSLLMRLAGLWAGSPHPFDLGGDNRTVGVLKETKRKSFGVEPLIAYWLSKELEGKTIRTILVGKQYRVDRGLMRQMVRDTYV